jgi:Spy/CpxP family protein refolding chaperone
VHGVIGGITMKPSFQKIVFPALAAFFAASVVCAQTPAPATTAATTAPSAAPEVGAHPFHRRGPLQRLMIRRAMAEKLGLTAEQQSQIRAARKSAAQQIKAIRTDTTLTPEDKKARIHSAVDTAVAQMKQVLTPDQQQKFEQLRAARRAAKAPAIATPPVDTPTR